MKTEQCDIVQDLLPLYADGSLSKASADLVDAHLAECEDCRTTLTQMQSETGIEAPDINVSASLNNIKKEAFGGAAAILGGILAVVVISFAALAIRYALPILRGFTPMDDRDLTVSVEDGNVVVTPTETKFCTQLFYIYRVNDDETISMYLTFSDANTQYSIAGGTWVKSEWDVIPFARSGEGGNFVGASAGGNCQLKRPTKITLHGNIKEVYYVKAKGLNEGKWMSVIRENAKALSKELDEIKEDGVYYKYIPTDGFDFDSIGETILIWSAEGDSN